MVPVARANRLSALILARMALRTDRTLRARLWVVRIAQGTQMDAQLLAAHFQEGDLGFEAFHGSSTASGWRLRP